MKKIFVVLIVILVIVLILALVWYYLNILNSNKILNQSKNSNNAQTSTNTVNSTAVLDTTSPKAVFLQFKKEVDTSTSFDALMVVSEKYESVAKIAHDAPYLPTTAEDKSKAFTMLMELNVTLDKIDTSGIIVDIQGNNATLTIKGKDGKQIGTAKMVKEGGIWKVDDIFWK